MNKLVKKTFSLLLSVSIAAAAMSDKPVCAAKKPKSLTMSEKTMLLKVKGKRKLKVVSSSPAGASKAVKYEIANRKIARVSKSGMVRGKKVGVTTIRVTSKRNKKLHVLIKVMVAKVVPQKVKMTASLTMTVGEQEKLTATVKPVKVIKRYRAGSWTSTDDNVVSVSGKGVVTANNAGEAVVSFTTFNGKTGTCRITVQPLPEPVPSAEPASAPPDISTGPGITAEPDMTELPTAQPVTPGAVNVPSGSVTSVDVEANAMGIQTMGIAADHTETDGRIFVFYRRLWAAVKRQISTLLPEC